MARFSVGDVVEWNSDSFWSLWDEGNARLKTIGPFIVTEVNVDGHDSWIYMKSVQTGEICSYKSGPMSADAWPEFALKLCEPFVAAACRAIAGENGHG